jgi:hypothetical protein
MGGGISRNKSHERVIDFENAQPTDGEMKVYQSMSDVLQQSQEILRKIEEYKGCQDLARKAMSQPTPENERAAFEGLLFAVDSIAHFFGYAALLDRAFPDLLLAVAYQPPEGKAHDKQALMKQLAQVFDFVLQFDATRMSRPNLSNDFSYYRRLLPKFSKHEGVRVKDDEASGMALFTAEHIPMMQCIAKAAARALDKNESVATGLSVLANSCLRSMKDSKMQENTNLFCARAMTGAIVLYDHIAPSGVFHKRSPIPVSVIIQLIQKDFPVQGPPLLNAIKFSTKNFKFAPEYLQQMLE